MTGSDDYTARYLEHFQAEIDAVLQAEKTAAVRGGLRGRGHRWIGDPDPDGVVDCRHCGAIYGTVEAEQPCVYPNGRRS